MDPQVAHEINQRGMTHYPMRKDGNCFFRAMAFALENQLRIPGFTARILRQRGVDYFLADDNLHVRFNNGQDQAAINAYADNMRQRGIFAEDEIIEAVAILLDVRIAILNNTNGVFNFFTLNQDVAPARTVYLLRTDIQGRPPHYDALLHQVLPLVATPAANNMLINSAAGKKTVVATQDCEKMLPPTLDALTDPNIDALYKEKIRPYLLQILKAQGAIDDEIEKISQEIPSQKVMLDLINELKQALNIAEAQLHEHLTEVKVSYKAVEKIFKAFMAEVSQWTEDHEYLTEGWGRFEEYDSADPDYDSGAAAAFSAKLNNKYVIDALDDDWQMCSLEDFIEHLQTLQRSVGRVMGAQDLIFENSAKIYDIYEALQEASKEVAALVESLDGAMPEDEYGHPANPYEKAAIQQGIDLFETLQGMLGEFEEAWEILSLRLKKYEAQQEEIEDTEADLDSALVKLGDEIENTTQNKKADSALPLKNLLGKYNKEITSQQKASLKHLITLLLRDKLDRPEIQSVLSQLQGMFAAKEKKLADALKKNKQPLEEHIPVLQDFIDLVRMQQKITELTDNQAVDIQAIVDALPNQIVPQIDTHALVLINDKTPAKKVFQMRVSSPQHPLDSLLVKLIRALAEKNIPRQHYARILYLPENRADLSDYERGVLSIMGVSSEKVSDHAAYKKTMQNKKPGTQTAGVTVHAIDASPHGHLARFITAAAYADPPNLNDFTAAHEQLYMRLTMYLVNYFCSAQNRSQFDIPEGHPVVCLIVSKTGEILAFSVNTRSVDPTSHAETNALRVYFICHPEQSRLPEGARVFTSLKSCEMCAGGIVCCATPNAPSVKVIYGQTDPAQINTVLHEKKLEQRCSLSAGAHANVFAEIDKVYEQQKAQESAQQQAQGTTQRVGTTNAAESLYTPSQQAHLQALTQHFMDEINTPTPSAVIVHMRAFVQAIGITCALAAGAAFSQGAASSTKRYGFK